MTALVNTETGEIVDTGAAERRAMKISLRLDSIAENFEAVMPMIREAIEKRDDLALGYRSPGDYVSDRFGQALSRLGMELRREVVRELTEAGLSTRAIAPVVGVSNKTVSLDLRAPVTEVTPETPAPTPEGEASEGAGQTPEGEVAPGDDRPVETAMPRPPVTGIDGKTYSSPTPKPPKPVLDGASAEYDNAEKSSLALARAISKLLQFQHPNMRSAMRRYWTTASIEVPPTPRRDVTPEQMRVAAHGLLALADEWEV